MRTEEQSALPGMPRRLFRATPTRLSTWSECPRRYRFSYLDKRPAAGAWAHSTIGAAAHNALRDWWYEPLDRRTPQTAAAAVRAKWTGLGFRDEEQSEQCRERTAEQVRAYAATLDPTDEPIGVERTVATTTGVLALSGRIDRLDQAAVTDGGRELVVVDYKTGRWVPGRDDAASSLALAVYAAAARRTLRARSVRVELHHLPSGTRVGLTPDDAALTRQLARADSIGAEARDAETRWQADLAPLAEAAAHGEAHAVDAIDAVLPPRPGTLCGWCDFREYCPEGSAAAPRKLPWEAVLSDPPGG